MTFIDGHEYLTVDKNGETWMKENLRINRFRDGTPFAQVIGHTVWSAAR